MSDFARIFGENELINSLNIIDPDDDIDRETSRLVFMLFFGAVLISLAINLVLFARYFYAL